MNVPVIMQKQVPAVQVVRKTVEAPQSQFIEKAMDIPAGQQKQVHMSRTVQKNVQTSAKQRNPKQSPDEVLDVPMDMASPSATVEVAQKMVEVPRVIPHERMLRPAGGGSSVRERAKRFEKEWGAKHMATVEGPRTSHSERQKESLVSDVEQDTCASADQPLGGDSLTHQAMETVDANIVPREVQSLVGEMTLAAGDHELKVVVHVESTFGEAAAQEREAEPPSKRRKQESDVEPQIPVHFSLSATTRATWEQSRWMSPPSSTRPKGLRENVKENSA